MVRYSAHLQRPQVQDELVRAGAVLAAEQDGVVLLQALRHVVRVQDRELGGVGQALQRGGTRGEKANKRSAQRCKGRTTEPMSAM